MNDRTRPLPQREYIRAITSLPKLPEMRKTLLDLEKRIKKMEEALSLEGKKKEK
jgi:hypothetical protein